MKQWPVLLIAAALASPGPARAGVAAIPCNVAPQEAAVRYFELIESPDFRSVPTWEYSRIFTDRLVSGSRITVYDTILDARRTFQGDERGAPLSSRLAAPPAVTAHARDQSASVRLLSFSSRGKIEQRMAMNCDKGDWKVDGFSYGQPESAGSKR